MSLAQTCVDAEAVIRRARALFGAPSGVGVPSGAGQLTDAAQAATSGRQRTAEMTGQGIPAYQDFVQRAVPPLHAAASSDASLAGDIARAAAVEAAGAQRLDSIAATTETLAAAAPSATTPDQQRAVLAALRGQLQQMSQVLQATEYQSNSTAGQVRDLGYPKDAPTGGGIAALDDQVLKGESSGGPRFESAGFGAGVAPLEPAPSPAPSPSEPVPTPFLPAWQQAMTAPTSAAPPPAIPLPAGGSPPPAQSFGDCFHEHMVPDLGKHMVSDGFSDAYKGAIGGAVAGAGLTPEGLGIGALPGGVLGFVGGFAKGAFEAPITAAGKSAAHCLLEEPEH